MGSNPARVACEVFSTDTRKALSILLYTRWCKGKIQSIVCHPTQEFHQPINLQKYWVFLIDLQNFLTSASPQQGVPVEIGSTLVTVEPARIVQTQPALAGGRVAVALGERVGVTVAITQAASATGYRGITEVVVVALVTAYACWIQETKMSSVVTEGDQ